MKKLYLAIISFCTFFSASSAQQYYPLLDSVNVWYYTSNYVPVLLENPLQSVTNCTYPVFFSQYKIESTTHDTLIGTNNYMIVESVSDFNPPCLFGFVREDTASRKIYFADNAGNPEILLYDFSMQIGDSIYLTFTSPGYFQDGYYRLDSITFVNVAAGVRRALHLNQTMQVSATLTWIEGVGQLNDVFYPYSINFFSMGLLFNCPGPPHDNFQFMTCFDHDYRVYYDSCAYHDALQNFCYLVTDTCNYWNICSSLDEISSLKSFTLNPNPTAGKIEIEVELGKNSDFNIHVFDISGKPVMKPKYFSIKSTGISRTNLDLSHLPNGFYLVELRTDEGSSFRKLLIQR